MAKDGPYAVFGPAVESLGRAYTDIDKRDRLLLRYLAQHAVDRVPCDCPICVETRSLLENAK